MKKLIPLLLVGIFLFSGCFFNKDKVAVEKTVNEMSSPMSSTDAAHFPKDFNPETKDAQSVVREGSVWLGAEFTVGKWEKQVEKVDVDGPSATAYLKWKLPLTAKVTVNDTIQTADLSIYGEGTYTLTKNADGVWSVTGYPRICWKNAYGPNVTDIAVSCGVSGSISATIDVNESVIPLFSSAVGYEPNYFSLLTQETETPTTFSGRPLSLITATPNSKHQGVITVFTVPVDQEKVLNYGITICYFETTIQAK